MQLLAAAAAVVSFNNSIQPRYFLLPVAVRAPPLRFSCFPLGQTLTRAAVWGGRGGINQGASVRVKERSPKFRMRRMRRRRTATPVVTADQQSRRSGDGEKYGAVARRASADEGDWSGLGPPVRPAVSRKTRASLHCRSKSSTKRAGVALCQRPKSEIRWR